LSVSYLKKMDRFRGFLKEYMTVNIAHFKAEAAIVEGDKHVYRLQAAHDRLQDLFPLTEQRLNDISDGVVETLDQFIYRFTKLQDCMGNRLFSALYTLTAPDDTPCPFLDVLNHLEKLRIIPSANDWMDLRNQRNNLAHEYPDSAEQQVKALNALFFGWPDLKEMYIVARQYYLDKLKLAP